MEVVMPSLEEIESSWAEDSTINQTQLGEEAAKIPKLHAKYYRLYVRELLNLKKQENTLKVLEKDLFMYYRDMMTPAELKAHNWKSLDIKILNPDVPKFIESNPEMITEKVKYSLIDEKCSFLKSILDSVNGRGWIIKHILDWKKFEAGG